VKSFGAVGDGVQDDSAAVLRAIAAAPDGGVVFFPAGK
jgi:polygalacturonase